tara:strand:+ start:1306 stop:2019 length:714 start_codon:yes stop_codon:yes gene_type:complete
MIYYIDDFLPQDQFDALAKRVKSGFRGDMSGLVENSDEPLRVTHHHESGSITEACNFLGQECRPAIDKMIDVMENDLGIQNLKNWSVWYQYIINTMTMPTHQDQALRDSDKANTFTSILYTSDWEPGWGGEFIVGEPVFKAINVNASEVKMAATGLKNLTHVIEPKPNRMLIWSREEWHAVQQVTVDIPNFKRSFLGTGWSSIDVSEDAMKEKFNDLRTLVNGGRTMGSRGSGGLRG